MMESGEPLTDGAEETGHSYYLSLSFTVVNENINMFLAVPGDLCSFDASLVICHVIVLHPPDA